MQKDESQIEPRFAAASAARCLFYYPLPCFFFSSFPSLFPASAPYFSSTRMETRSAFGIYGRVNVAVSIEIKLSGIPDEDSRNNDTNVRQVKAFYQRDDIKSRTYE